MTGPDVAALVGGAIVVDAEVGGRVLALALRRAKADAARNGVPFDRALVALLAVAEQAERQLATASRNRTQPAAVSVLAGPGFPGGGFPQVEGSRLILGSGEVARRAGVSVQAVRKAARMGRLAGQLRCGAWVFSEAAVSRWLNGRRPGGSADSGEAA